MSEATLDARNLLCPLPVIRTQDRAETMEPGECLLIQYFVSVDATPCWNIIDDTVIGTLNQQAFT